MSVAILGGLDRLKPFYKKRGRELGFSGVKVFSQKVPNLGRRMQGFDGIVICTGTVAHPMVEEAVRVARDFGIPVGRTHSSSVSALKKSLAEISAVGKSPKNNQ